VDVNHELRMTLNSGLNEVVEDMNNITRALTELSGFDVHSHVVQAHAGRGTGNGDSLAANAEDLINEVFGNNNDNDVNNHVDYADERSEFRNGDESTDVFLYALESNRLVETDRMIRSLSGQLMKAKKDLSPHNLVEVRAGKSFQSVYLNRK